MASAIASAYYRRIKAGKITLQEVLDNPNIGDDVKREVSEMIEND